MNNFFRCFLLVMLAGCGFNVFANDCNNIAATKWLLGNWQTQPLKSTTTEQWYMLDDKSLVGVGTTNHNNSNKPPFIEALRVVEMGGEVFYLAKPPQNELPVAFKLVECSNKYLKFANPQHDFPQTIEYTLHSSQRMVALVSGGGKSFSLDFGREAGDVKDNTTRVQTYVDAYNRRDLKAMLEFTHQDIGWMSVYDDKVAVETKNQAELKAALKQHFARPSQSTSSLLGLSSYGDFVSAIEKVTSMKNGKTRSACSLSVYQFDHDLIKAVWYYPAQSCR